MPKISLANMSVESLIDLRKRVETTLAQRQTDLERQLKALGSFQDGARVVRGRGASPLTGRKVPAKYRDASGNTWTGRGQKPKWLIAAMKDTGKRIEEFLIEERGRARRRKRRMGK